MTCWTAVKDFNSFYESVNRNYSMFDTENILKPLSPEEPIDDYNLENSIEDSDSDEDSIKTDKKTKSTNTEKNQKIEDFYKIECDLCNTKLETYNEVNKHFLEVHKQKGYIKCCNKKLSRRNKLLNHMER